MSDAIKQNANRGLFSWSDIAEKYINVYDIYKEL